MSMRHHILFMCESSKELSKERQLRKKLGWSSIFAPYYQYCWD